ncbi:helix-turn-helix domain-containing protein [Caulobacter sp. FWC26]|uniref:helix-turn-helix domain-containing protein n=1 Tax=Caulobacter sp. FWC26 TaxID=69665 RepID=UPI000C15D662|nr:helix-turn-helix domain-containing protein [Caulobacter sp. FWC26]AZS19182.1 helix-turn-helix domain-containing protein [Caulobacter sp. FWC26]
MSAKDKSPSAEADLRTNEKKWSKPLMDAGWTVFPSVIIENQRQLGLDAMDVNILLHLASKWWNADGKPYPSKGTIALAMNVDPRTVQRRIAALEAAGLIRREERRETPTGSKTNVYHLDGLIEAAQPFAEEKLAEIEERRAIKKAKAARKGAPKPKLKLVKSDVDDD